MNIIDAATQLLGSSGYSTTPADRVVLFEDPSLLGVLVAFGSVAELIDGWSDTQAAFLREQGASLRRDRRKAWNVYTVLLCQAAADSGQRVRLAAIEEDFRSTRKIARCGLRTERDVERALVTLLPIRHRVALGGSRDLPAQIVQRVSSIPPEAVRELLAGAPAERIADMLLEES